jgi:hypothetical protein
MTVGSTEVEPRFETKDVGGGRAPVGLVGRLERKSWRYSSVVGRNVSTPYLYFGVIAGHWNAN